ncbi:MAG: cysteine desulfurase family protein [Deltaproteobacteria bacterium]|jgi:cysteine desulfurase
MKRIYLDNNATTPLDPAVREAMAPYLAVRFGNPSSAHLEGEVARDAVELAREKVAALLASAPGRVAFTSGGTEANNTAIWSAVAAFPEKKHLISSRVEHDSVLQPLFFLRDRFGYEVELLPVDGDGGLDLEKLAAAIRPDTCLVTLIGGNNETGVMWPVAEIGALCREREVLFHCDAVQLIGKTAVHPEELAVDYLSLASHKLHGPKGIGALWARRRAPLTSLIMGSGQESGRRSGTENVPGIAGFGAACELAAAARSEETRVAALRDGLEAGVLAAVDEVRINGRALPRLPNTSNLSFRNCSAAALIQDLDQLGFAVSAHAACHSGDSAASHVLIAMEVPEDYLYGTLRVSLSRYTTEAEIDAFLAALPEVIAKSRQVM